MIFKDYARDDALANLWKEICKGFCSCESASKNFVKNIVLANLHRKYCNGYLLASLQRNKKPLQPLQISVIDHWFSCIVIIMPIHTNNYSNYYITNVCNEYLCQSFIGQIYAFLQRNHTLIKESTSLLTVLVLKH